MLKSKKPQIEAELHIAPKWIPAVLFFSGMVFIILSSLQPITNWSVLKCLIYCLFLLRGGGYIPAFEETHPGYPALLPYLAVGSCCKLGICWLTLPGFLILVPIP